jgi:hypothetical protein
MSPGENLPGRLGRYDVGDPIGATARGLLCAGRDVDDGRDVAIEVIGREAAGSEAAVSRFLRDARAAVTLRHPNLAAIITPVEDEPVVGVVTEPITGERLDRAVAHGSPPRLDEALDTMVQVCLALQAAHEVGLVHRDLTPAGIYVQPDGVVTVTGLGTGRLDRAAAAPGHGSPGHAVYLAPEQLAGEDVDGRADVFAAGAILYELVAGLPAFTGRSRDEALARAGHAQYRPLGEVAAGIPGPIASIVARALEPAADDRYLSAFELAADLANARATLDEELLARRPGAATARAGSGEARSEAAGWITGLRVLLDGTGRPIGRSVALAAAAAVVAVLAGGVAVSRWLRDGGGGVAAGDDRTATAVQPGPPAAEPAMEPEPRPVPAPPPEPAPAPLRLRVTSVPDGAEIVLAGRATGLVTPADIELPPATAAPVRLRLVKPGYLPLDLPAGEAHLRAGTIAGRLEAEGPPVEVAITGAYEFEIRDGTRIASARATSHRLTVPVNRTLRLVAPEVFLDAPVVVRRTGQGRIEYRAPDLGELSVRSARFETCEVSIGGRPLGPPPHTPPISRVPIAAGSHTIVLRCGQTVAYRQTVTVRPGELKVESIR